MSLIKHFALVLIWLSLGAVPAMAQDLLQSKALFEDVTGQMTIDQIERADFVPLKGLLIAGYSQSAYWIRLDVRPSPNDQPVQLRIRPTFLDQVEIYEPRKGLAGQWVMRATGDRSPFISADRSDVALGFQVFPSAPVTTYYLRIKTSSTMMMQVQALSVAEAQLIDARLRLLQLAVLLFIAGTIVWALYDWVTLGFGLAGAFAQFQLMNFLFLSLVSGRAATLSPPLAPDTVDTLTSLSILLTTLSWVWFIRQLFVTYRAQRAMKWVFNGLLLGCVGLGVAYFLGFEQWALQCNILLVLLASASGFVISCLLHLTPTDLPSIVRLRIVMGLLLVVFWFALLPFTGFEPLEPWVLETNVGYGFMTAVLMLSITLHKSRQFRKSLQAQSDSLVRLSAQLDGERKHGLGQRQLIEIMTHEIKTALSTAMMSLGALKSDSSYVPRIRKSLLNINAVTERIAMAEMTEHKQIKASRAPCDLVLALQDCIVSCSTPSRIQLTVPQELTIETDCGLFCIIVSNLIDNALKYSPVNSTISIVAQLTAGRACVQIRNAVDSLLLPDSTKLFNKYYRGTGAMSKSGSGLGLFLAQNLAHLLDGQLRYLPDDHGVCFELCLPA